MRSTEDLLRAVRSRQSQNLLQEAVRAYQAGALKSSIVSLWVAVSVDLTLKIRELADAGDGAAKQYVSELDGAIAGLHVPTLQSLETGLLDKVLKDFEMINAREHTELSRLYADRHVCAHPAFVDPEKTFSPTSEQCRAYLVLAVDAVLSQGPTPGKRLLERFRGEALGESWPMSMEDLREHLRVQYFSRAKSSARRSLAGLIVSGCLLPQGVEHRTALRHAQAAHALAVIAPDLLGDALKVKVRQREEGSGMTDDELVWGTCLLGDLDAYWQALPASSHSRAISALANVDLTTLYATGVTSRLLALSGAASVVQDRLSELDVSDLAQLVQKSSGRPVVVESINRLTASRSFADANIHLRQLILPLSGLFTTGDIQAIADAVTNNDQVRGAWEAPAVLAQVASLTTGVQGAPEIWRLLDQGLRASMRSEVDTQLQLLALKTRRPLEDVKSSHEADMMTEAERNYAYAGLSVFA